MPVLEFVFSGFWVFIGSLMLLSVVCALVSNLVKLAVVVLSIIPLGIAATLAAMLSKKKASS